MLDRDAAAIDAFVDCQRAKNLAESSIRNRRSYLKTLAATAGTLLDIDVFTLRRHVVREGVAPATKRTERGAFVAVFAFLKEEGLRDDNPAVRLPVIRVSKGEPRPLTTEQVDALPSSGAYRKTRAMILLGYFQGFRVSSIASVHGRDIDFDTMTIQTVGKGGESRELPLHPMIAELAQSMPRDGKWFRARAGRTEHVHPASVTQRITLAKRRTGIVSTKLAPTR